MYVFSEIDSDYVNSTKTFDIIDINGATHTIAEINFNDYDSVKYPGIVLRKAINDYDDKYDTGVRSDQFGVNFGQTNAFIYITSWPDNFSRARLISFDTTNNAIRIDAGKSFPTTDEPFFSITDNVLKSNAVFDYEEKDLYAITVRTTDQNNNTYSEVITININDLDDIPTAITLSPNDIDENNIAGAEIGKLSTVDGYDSTYTYILLDNTAIFSISGTNTLIANNSFDFEEKGSYAANSTHKCNTSVQRIVLAS